jgi:hypothetical protein
MNTKPAGSAFPFAGNLLESLEMMGKAWGAGLAQMPGFSTPASMAQAIPSMMVPTLDVNELDKRITDLRAVEQWLALNANMLRASIQALEVQRNTIATLQTLGATMMKAPVMEQSASAPSPFSATAAAPSAGTSGAEPTATASSRRAKKPATADAPPPNFAELPLNPAAWWSNLQDQFTRIAAAAAGEPRAAESAGKEGTAKGGTAKDDGKPAARKPPSRRTS